MIIPIEMFIVIATVISAFIAIEARETLHAIVSFLVMSVFLAVIFFILNAPYAAVFQLLIYAGAVVVLLLVTFHTVKR